MSAQRSIKDLANLLQMGESAIYNRWDKFRKLTNLDDSCQFSTCEESLIDDFALWLQDEDRKAKDEEIYQKKIEEYEREKTSDDEYKTAVSGKKKPEYVFINVKNPEESIKDLLKYFSKNELIKAIAKA